MERAALADLEALVPVPTVLELADGRVEVSPLTVRQLPAFLRAAAPILAEASASGDVAALLLRYPDNVIDACAAALSRPREWVEALPVDELVRLAGEVLAVNADFFVRRIRPAIDAAAARIQTALAAAGPMPSPGSSAGATAT